MIRRTAVRETDVSLRKIMRAQLRTPPETPRGPSQHYRIGGFKGPLIRPLLYGGTLASQTAGYMCDQ